VKLRERFADLADWLVLLRHRNVMPEYDTFPTEMASEYLGGQDALVERNVAAMALVRAVAESERLSEALMDIKAPELWHDDDPDLTAQQVEERIRARARAALDSTLQPGGNDDDALTKASADVRSGSSYPESSPGEEGETQRERERADRLEVECRELEDANRSLVKMRDAALEGNLVTPTQPLQGSQVERELPEFEPTPWWRLSDNPGQHANKKELREAVRGLVDEVERAERREHETNARARVEVRRLEALQDQLQRVEEERDDFQRQLLDAVRQRNSFKRYRDMLGENCESLRRRGNEWRDRATKAEAQIEEAAREFEDRVKAIDSQKGPLGDWDLGERAAHEAAAEFLRENKPAPSDPAPSPEVGEEADYPFARCRGSKEIYVGSGGGYGSPGGSYAPCFGCPDCLREEDAWICESCGKWSAIDAEGWEQRGPDDAGVAAEFCPSCQPSPQREGEA
jgi:hypothetical protein